MTTRGFQREQHIVLTCFIGAYIGRSKREILHFCLFKMSVACFLNLNFKPWLSQQCHRLIAQHRFERALLVTVLNHDKNV